MGFPKIGDPNVVTHLLDPFKGTLIDPCKGTLIDPFKATPNFRKLPYSLRIYTQGFVKGAGLRVRVQEVVLENRKNVDRTCERRSTLPGFERIYYTIYIYIYMYTYVCVYIYTHILYFFVIYIYIYV